VPAYFIRNSFFVNLAAEIFFALSALLDLLGKHFPVMDIQRFYNYQPSRRLSFGNAQ
jgi:hypothetical protein